MLELPKPMSKFPSKVVEAQGSYLRFLDKVPLVNIELVYLKNKWHASLCVSTTARKYNISTYKVPITFPCGMLTCFIQVTAQQHE